MKFLIGLVVLCLFAISSPAQSNVFVAQSAVGAGSGVDCANAKVLSSFTAWVSGLTLNLCGNFTVAPGQSLLIAKASNVTIKFVAAYGGTQAVVSSPRFAANGGAINIAGRQNVLIEGNGVGVIENTENGTGLAFAVPSAGIDANSCFNCKIQNLTIQNIYVRRSVTDLSLPSASTVPCIVFNGATGMTINHVKCRDAGWAFAGSGNNITLMFSEASNVDHGVAAGAEGPLVNYVIHDNFFHDFMNWDSGAANWYHHDGIHLWALGMFGTVASTWNGVQIYNNIFDGDQGAGNTTAFVFLQGQVNNSTVDHNRFHVMAGESPIAPMSIGNAGNSPTQATGNIVDHNVVVIDNNGGLFKVAGAAISLSDELLVTVTNNIVMGGIWDLGLSNGTTIKLIDNNLYEDVQHDFGSNNAWGYQGHSYHDLATWQQVCGCDQHSQLIAYRR